MGDPDADEENAVLKAEQDAQVKALHCLFLIDLAICLHSHNTVLYLMPILRLERIPVAMLLFYRLLLLILGNIEVIVLSIHLVPCNSLLALTFYHFFLLSGKLDKAAVLKAICAGFQETTEPAVCLSEGIIRVSCDN